MPENPQHYIGDSSFGRVHVTFDLNALAKMGKEPTEALTIEGVTLHPVSAAVAEVWDHYEGN